MKKEEKQVRILIALYVSALVISGYTAMIVPQGLKFLLEIVPSDWTIIYQWLQKIETIISQTSIHVLYGFDWLAFAHFGIAMSFYGVWKDPVRNRWVIDWAMWMSIAIFPFAFVMGYIREIPFWWQLIDCSFGVVSLIPLIMIHRRICVLEKAELEDCRVLKFF